MTTTTTSTLTVSGFRNVSFAFVVGCITIIVLISSFHPGKMMNFQQIVDENSNNEGYNSQVCQKFLNWIELRQRS